MVFFSSVSFLNLLEALQGTSSTFSRPEVLSFRNPSDEMQNFEILDFLLPVFPTKMPQRITSEDLTFERQVFFYILSGNLTTGQQELPRSQRDSQSISERHWDAVLSVEGLFFCDSSFA